MEGILFPHLKMYEFRVHWSFSQGSITQFQGSWKNMVPEFDFYEFCSV